MEQQQFFVSDRGLLDSLLDEPRTSLMLILGKEGSREEKLYYEILSHVREPWRRVALIVRPPRTEAGSPFRRARCRRSSAPPVRRPSSG